MDTKKAISLTINKTNLQFIDVVAQKQNKTKSEIIDYILDMYRKYQLKNQIQRGFQNQDKKDAQEAMSDFADYLSMVERV